MATSGQGMWLGFIRRLRHEARRARGQRFLPLLVVLAVALFSIATVSACGDDSDDQATDDGPDPTAASAEFGFEPETSSIKVATSFRDATSLPVKFAEDLGVYEKYGLDVELVQVATDAQEVQSMANGAVQAMSVGSAILPSAARAGETAVMVAPTQTTVYDMLVAQEGISDPQELVGKKVAVSDIGDDTHMSVALALDELGIAPDDVTVVKAGFESDRLAALRAGSVDAAPVDQSLKPRMEREGFNVLLELGDADVRAPRHGLAVSQEFIEENPGTTQALVAAYFEAHQAMFSDTEAAVETYAEWAQLDEQDARESLEVVLPLMEENDQRCMGQKAEWWERATDLLGLIEPDLADVDPQSLWSTEFIDELIDNGFAEEVGAPC